VLILIRRVKRCKSLTYLLTSLLIFFTLFFTGLYMTCVTVDDERITVNVPVVFTSKSVWKDEVVRVFIIDWNSDESYRPSLIRLGVSLLEYKVGWFTFNNGRSALLISSSSRNLTVETKKGELILLSPSSFKDFTTSFKKVFLPAGELSTGLNGT